MDTVVWQLLASVICPGEYWACTCDETPCGLAHNHVTAGYRGQKLKAQACLANMILALSYYGPITFVNFHCLTIGSNGLLQSVIHSWTNSSQDCMLPCLQADTVLVRAKYQLWGKGANGKGRRLYAAVAQIDFVRNESAT